MITALCVAVAILIAGLSTFHWGSNFGVAGAGAPGSILMLIGAVVVIISIFTFGIAVGLAIA